MPRTRKTWFAFIGVIATLTLFVSVPAIAEDSALTAAKVKEANVLYGALVATTHAAAYATGNLSFWEQAVDAANTADSPLSVLLDLMLAADWAYDALTIWHDRYSGVNIEAAYAEASQLYAEQSQI